MASLIWAYYPVIGGFYVVIRTLIKCLEKIHVLKITEMIIRGRINWRLLCHYSSSLFSIWGVGQGTKL